MDNLKDLIGKTIIDVENACINYWSFTFTDGTKIAIESNISSHDLTGLSFLDLSGVSSVVVRGAVNLLGSRSWGESVAEAAVKLIVASSSAFGINRKTTSIELAVIAGKHWLTILSEELEELIQK